MDKVSFELLLVKDIGEQYQVVGITYSDAGNISPEYLVVRATLFAIELCKKALAENKVITISKSIEHSEVQPHELVIEAPTDFDRYKQVALNEVRSKLNQAVLAINVIDAMDYLDCYINLLNSGCFITDSNREEKYAEILQTAQDCSMPEQLKENASFEDEQQYIEAKDKHERAQENLKILERYLICYDKLVETKRTMKFFTEVQNKITNAKTKEDIDFILMKYRADINTMQIVNVVN